MIFTYAILVTFLIAAWFFLFFVFDNLVLGGVIARNLKSWAERKFNETSEVKE